MRGAAEDLTTRRRRDTEHVFMQIATPFPLSLLDEPCEPGTDDPPELSAAVQLFDRELATVSFPDVDAASLRKAAQALQARRLDVERATEALRIARAIFAEQAEGLRLLARRGLAYARIYADAHPELGALHAALAQLETRGEPAADSGAAPRRGRRRAPRPELPFLPTEPAPPRASLEPEEP